MSYTSLGFNKQDTGSGTNVWGQILNSECFDLIDEAIRGMASFTLSGAVALDATNGQSNQARCAILNITGGTGGTVTIPSISKFYLVRNAATGSAVISTGGANTAEVEPGMVMPVVSDGSEVWTLRIAGLSLRQYIDAAALSATGSLPATEGNEGKTLSVVSGQWTPKTPLATDLGDYSAAVIGRTAAIAIALSQ